MVNMITLGETVESRIDFRVIPNILKTDSRKRVVSDLIVAVRI